MRFSTIFLSTVVAALSVQAQANNGTATESAAVSGTSKPNAAQQSAAVCLESCKSSIFQIALSTAILTTSQAPPTTTTAAPSARNWPTP